MLACECVGAVTYGKPRSRDARTGATGPHEGAQRLQSCGYLPYVPREKPPGPGGAKNKQPNTCYQNPGTRMKSRCVHTSACKPQHMPQRTRAYGREQAKTQGLQNPNPASISLLPYYFLPLLHETTRTVFRIRVDGESLCRKRVGGDIP